MLEITHKQAQYLIRQSLDARSGDGRRLPEEQWSALQAHLEGCAECRAYRDRAVELEKRLRRTLAGRWHSVGGPRGSLESDLPRSHRAQREHAQRVLGMGLRLLLVIFAGLGVFAMVVMGGLGQRAKAPMLPSPTPLPTASPTPTLAPGERFDGAVLYEGREPFDPEGPTEIYLLRTGPTSVEISNMTMHPANDSHPVWSPDGEWIAFLSDRSEEGQTGKNELYVMSIAGTRLTRITNTPEVAWEGPPVWSPDGEWIALIGRRQNLDGISWIYLIPLSPKGEGGPVAVPDTRGVSGPLRFSMNPFTGDQSLLYRAPNLSVIHRFHLAAGMTEAMTDPVPEHTVGAAFEMRPYSDFLELVYTLEGPDGVSVRREIESPLRARRTYILQNLPSGSASGLSFVPQAPRAVFVSKPDVDDCQEFVVWRIDPEPFLQWDLDFCMIGVPASQFDPQQLRAAPYFVDGSWALLQGTDRESGIAGLFALQIPYDPSFGKLPKLQLLAEVPGMTGPPRVRPDSSNRLSIDPLPAAEWMEIPPQVEPVPFLGGEVLMAVQEEGGSRIVSMEPDGGREQTLIPSTREEKSRLEGARYQCPVLSPDESQVAFLSDHETSPLDFLELFVIDLEDRGLHKLEIPHLLYAAYDCPVWSPDGQALAVVVRAFGIGYLAVFPAGESEPIYVTINQPSEKTLPVWSPDSSKIYIATPRRMGYAPGIAKYEWRGAEEGLLSRDSFMDRNLFIELDGWDDVQGISLSPDGSQMALVVIRDRPSRVELRVLRMSDQRLAYRKQISGYDPGSLRGIGHILWLQDRQVVFAQYNSPLEKHKAQIWRYNPAEDTLQNLVTSEDVLLDWTIKGGWMVFSTESGLWGDSVAGLIDRPSAPIRLNDWIVTSLSWR